MITDIQKHVSYWLESGIEDMETAELLVASRRIRHGLFFAHLAMEKIIKAHICKHTKNIAPRIHNLLRLSAQSGINFSDEQTKFLARFDRYQIEGRYPEFLPASVSQDNASKEIEEVKEFFSWLISQL
jgi:HEPN domain-containing protein